MHVLTARRYSLQVREVWIRETLRPESAISSGLLDASGSVQGGARTPGHQVYVSREDSDCLKLQGDIKKLMASDDHRSLRLCCRRIAHTPLELVAY
jgi:hypothetical protein